MTAATTFDALRVEAPNSAALPLDVLHTLWRLLAHVERQPQHVLTYGWFQTVFHLSTSQARTRVALLQREGLIRSTLIGSPTRPQGYRYQVTNLGQRLCRLLAPLFTKPDAGKQTAEPTPARPRAAQSSLVPRDLRPLLSEKARTRFLAMPQVAQTEIDTALRRGEEPDYAVLSGAGLDDPLLVEIERYFQKLLGAAQDKRVGQGETLVPAAGEDKLHAARVAGIAVPSVEARSPAAEAVAETARLLLREAAARHPNLLRTRLLEQRLPEILWASLQGSLADYGPLLLRVRCALKWLSSERWQCPRGFSIEDGSALMNQILLRPAIH